MYYKMIKFMSVSYGCLLVAYSRFSNFVIYSVAESETTMGDVWVTYYTETAMDKIVHDDPVIR
jgi:hypothetical protein